jgi:hypothetical protein
MAEVGFAQSPALPREIERRADLSEFGPAASTRAVTLVPRMADSPELSEVEAGHDQELNAGTIVNLRKLQEALARRPLDEIADLVRALTFGEMIEFSDAVWAAQPGGTSITRENLPRLLHHWSKSHGGKETRAPKGAGTQADLNAPAIDLDAIDVR